MTRMHKDKINLFDPEKYVKLKAVKEFQFDYELWMQMNFGKCTGFDEYLKQQKITYMDEKLRRRCWILDTMPLRQDMRQRS